MDLLKKGMNEDVWNMDWTTIGCLGRAGAKKQVKARIISKAGGIWACAGLKDAIEGCSAAFGMLLEAKNTLEDGQRFKAGQVVMYWAGSARMVLAMERSALNLAQYACGIATATAELTDIVARTWKKYSKTAKTSAPRVTATRKTLPFYRDLAIHSVVCGGGRSHRVNLAGGVLVKENHIAAAGGIAGAVKGARAAAPHGLKIEVEVRNQIELQQAVEAGADAVLLDNFKAAQVKKAIVFLKTAAPGVLVEASGGINDRNIQSFVLPGVDVISCGGLTHSVRAVDFTLLVDG
ncbi:MAG: nicotinate-nucleotide diphosphorylase (carboxylating) [Bdellovibrionales bacterium RIFOXYD1_FULL_53_11]|nr:MAG: nicotinate-nucleotide diphosphorylase (carboxylating) [Bdellovibrionales bacterium RIFOXYD1_FULL_53_11]